MIKVAFIEDDFHFSRTACEALKMQPDLVCMLKVPSIEDFWAKLPVRAHIDILFLDIELPGQSGVEALPALRKRLPQTEIVMLTQIEDNDVLLRALHNGASGYLNKDFPIFQLPHFIQIIRKGGALISPLMARKVVQFFNPSPISQKTETLHPKEIQVLQLFSEGYSYEETGSAMGISTDGVRYHVRNIYRKLNVNNKMDALRSYKTY